MIISLLWLIRKQKMESKSQILLPILYSMTSYKLALANLNYMLGLAGRVTQRNEALVVVGSFYLVGLSLLLSVKLKLSLPINKFLSLCKKNKI
ncbi:MAG: hypothetical protein JWQ25_638, partial [Daejeonella sp.]|nr:hypothetical protein [Daejeonella sp.]